jgi:hypothetical protein
VRSLGLLIGCGIALLLIQVAQQEAGGKLGLLVCLSFVLAPQLSFICSLVSNDGLAILLSTATLLLGRRQLEKPSALTAVLVALTGPLTVWTKASGAFLLAPLAVLALALWRRGSRLLAVAALAPTFCAVAVFLVAWQPRFEIFRAVYGSEIGLRNHPELLLKYPFWWIQLWGSFFAKFTQFQLKLPWPLYLVFFPASFLVLLGLMKAWQQRKTLSPSVYWAAGIISNLALLVYFWIFVDFQHQGRLLWPSVACFVGCAALAGSNFKLSEYFPSIRQKFSACFAIFYVILLSTNLVGMLVIARDEGLKLGLSEKIDG